MCTVSPFEYESFNPFVRELIKFANNKDPDQAQPNAEASDRDLCCLPLSQDIQHHYPSSKPRGTCLDVELDC